MARRRTATPSRTWSCLGRARARAFAPVAGVLIAESIAFLLEADDFAHFQTYGGNPIACAVGRRVLEALAEEEIAARVRGSEADLERALRSLLEIPVVSDVRGIGYLWAVELSQDRETGRPFPRDRRVAERVADGCRERGVLVHAGVGCFDGVRGDFILIAPPLITGKGSFDTIVEALAEAIPAATR